MKALKSTRNKYFAFDTVESNAFCYDRDKAGEDFVRELRKKRGVEKMSNVSELEKLLEEVEQKFILNAVDQDLEKYAAFKFEMTERYDFTKNIDYVDRDGNYVKYLKVLINKIETEYLS